MSFLKQMWLGALEKVFDIAFGLMLRTRRTLLPPKPIVWEDPRPFRGWTTDLLRDEFAKAHACDVHPHDRDERTARCSLILEEILARRGQSSRPTQNGYD